MAKITMSDYKKIEERTIREKHKELIATLGEDIAIKTIKREIPEGKKLKEYLEELRKEIKEEVK